MNQAENIVKLAAIASYFTGNTVKVNGDIDIQATMRKLELDINQYNMDLKIKEAEILEICDLELEHLGEDVTISIDKLCASIAFQDSKQVDRLEDRKSFIKNILLKHSSDQRCNPARYFRKVKGKGSGLCLWANKLAL